MALKNGRTTTVVQAILVGSVIPSGTISPFGGGTVPSGWLLCDGTAVSRTTYASLYASILHANGYGDTSTTFNLPDLRGRFLRGVDGIAGNDPDKAGRTAMATGGNAGNLVGSIQAAETLSHTHIQDVHGHAALGTAAAGGAFANLGQAGLNALGGSSQGSGLTYILNATANGNSYIQTTIPTNQNTGGNETRPKNANVNYIIKV